MTVPEPRQHHEHVEPCRRHHVHLVICPECNAWHRHLLDRQREEAAERAARKAAT